MKQLLRLALGLAALSLLLSSPALGQTSPDPHAGRSYSGKGDVQPPKLLHQVEPEYTDEAQRHHIEGKAVITVMIEKDGSLHDPIVVEKLGSGLDEQALHALQLWRFSAGSIDGEPIATRVTVEMDFVLAPPSRR